MHTITATITDIARLTNSASGNPRYTIELDTGDTYRTPADSMFAYEVHPAMIGQRFHLAIDGRRITGMDRCD